MSIDAIRWALAEPIKPASTKLLLISFADRANEEHLAWPSTKRLAFDTGLDLKTITASIQKLVEAGYLIDTGERKGRTGMVRVYQLVGVPSREQTTPKTVRLKRPQRASGGLSFSFDNEPKNGVIVDSNHTENGVLNDTENGVTKPHRKRCLEPVSIEPYREVEAQQPFRMRLDWQPAIDGLDRMCQQVGVTIDPLTPECLTDFCLYWSGRREYHTQSQWIGKYLKNLKRHQEKTKVNDLRHQRELREAQGSDKDSMGFLDRHTDRTWSDGL